MKDADARALDAILQATGQGADEPESDGPDDSPAKPRAAKKRMEMVDVGAEQP